MRRLSFGFIGFVAIAWAAGCGDGGGESVDAAAGGDGGGGQACGAAVCTANQECDRSSTPPRCKCLESYTGPDCQTCARGYTAVNGACRPAAIDCDANPRACGTRGMCVKGSGLFPDQCVCQAGYTGYTCQTCADGYQDNDNNDTCAPSCKMTMTTCAAPRVCSDTSGTAACSCPPGTSGTSCDACMSGFMKAADGTCQPCPPNTTGTNCASCVAGTMRLADGTCQPCPPNTTGTNCASCVAGTVRMSDGSCQACPPNTTGTNCASCVAGTVRMPDGSCKACPSNTTGTTCELCVTGTVRAPDGSCVPSCSAGNTCGARRFCDETQGTPMCVCQAGFTGADCSGCAAGFTADAMGRCVGPIPAGTTLLGAATYQGAQYLMALNPSAGTAAPIRQLAALSSLTQLTADPATKTIYAIASTGVNRLDLASGLLTPIATVSSTNTLAFGDGALFTLPTLSPYPLKRINPATGAVQDLCCSMVPMAHAMTWEPTGKLLVARAPAGTPGAGPELFRVDPLTAGTTRLGMAMFDAERLQASDTRTALAVEPTTGRPFLATRIGRTPQELVIEHCRALSLGLGAGGQEPAVFSSIETPYDGIGAGMTKVISSKMSGKEAIAYVSYGRRATAAAKLRIETTNPEAFVCVSTYEEVLQLDIAASARFAAVVVAGARPTVSLIVEAGFPPTTNPTVHVFGGTGSTIDTSVRAFSVARVYTQQEWTERRLPTYVSVWSGDSGAPVRLVELDPGTWAVKQMHSFAGVTLSPLLVPWAP